MNKKYIGLLIIFFSLLNYISAQNRMLEGVITDSLQNPIAFANVIAKPANPNLDLAFSLTNEKGNYQLQLFENETYIIETRYLGYEPVIFQIDSSFLLTEKNIILFLSKNELQEVIVIEKLPIAIDGDTTVYQTDAFTNGEERKLKQVLKKLPGVEVDKNGTVTVHGKKVDKILVEGEDFFGGGSKLAVENIPADAVGEVEVIDNYNEVAFLSEVSDSDQLAMNIKLKEDKKNFIFGEVTVGGGVDENYLVHPNLFYYSPRTNFNFIGDINNVGEQAFTFTDQMNFEGGIGKLLANPSSFMKFSSSDLLQFSQTEDVSKYNNTFAGLNFKQKINSKISLDGYTILSKLKTIQEQLSQNQYLTDSFPTSEDRFLDDEFNNSFGMTKVTLDYIPKNNIDISYNFLIKKSLHLNDKQNLITTNNLDNFVNNKNENNTFSIRQNFERHQKHTQKHSSSFVLNHFWKDGNTVRDWLTDSEVLPFLIPLQEAAPFDISQFKKTKYHQLDVLWKHYFVLNRLNHIYVSVGDNWVNQAYQTNETQLISDDVIINFREDGFGNEMDFQLNDFYFGLNYKFKKGIVSTTLGLTPHYYLWKIKNKTTENKDKWVLAPSIKSVIKFSKGEKLEFNYQLKSSFSDASNFADRFYLQSFNSLFSGNPNLENELSHATSLRYIKSNWLKSYNLNIRLSHQRKTQRIQNEITLLGISSVTSPIMVFTPHDSWKLRFKFRKGIKKIDLKFKINISFSKFEQTINIQKINREEITSLLGVNLLTNFKKYPNIEIGYNYTNRNYNFGISNSKFNRTEPYLEINYSFLDGFIFFFDFHNTNFKNDSGIRSIYSLTNTSLFYQKEDSPWSFELKATNLFDVKNKRQSTFSNFTISDRTTAVLPRIVLLKIGYHL